MITKDFEEIALSALFRNDDSQLTTFFIGLCSNTTADRNMTLADIVETTGPGYARIEVGRNATKWQEPQTQPDCMSISTTEQNFSASGTWTPFRRMFLATSSDNSGKLLAMSTPLPVEVTLNNGDTYPAAMEVYLK